MFVLSILLSSVDTYSEVTFQHECMKRLTGWTPPTNFEGVLEDTRINRSQKYNPDDACTWRGVTCNGHRVTSIEWSFLTAVFNGRLDWLPRSLESIKTVSSIARHSFSLRSLPPNLRSFKIMFGFVRCEMVFDKIPEKITTISLLGNMLTGTLVISQVPLSLETLDLWENYITEIITSTRAIPADCKMLYEQQNDQKKCVLIYVEDV